MIEAGSVTVDGAVVQDAKARVAEGAVISITVEEAEDSHIGPEDISLDVIFEDDDLIVINKPAGMVVHPAPGTPSGTLVNALLHHCGENLSGVGGIKRPGIVHRIDKETSGLLVVALVGPIKGWHNSLRDTRLSATIAPFATECLMPTTRVCAG